MMKDKLYKTNHKTMYYVTRKILLSFTLFLGVGIAVGVPTTVNLLSSGPLNVTAQENKEEEEKVEDIEDNKDDEVKLLSYN